MIAQKQRVKITLDIECYDDLNFDEINWEKLLGLEGDETIAVTIKEEDRY